MHIEIMATIDGTTKVFKLGKFPDVPIPRTGEVVMIHQSKAEEKKGNNGNIYQLTVTKVQYMYSGNTVILYSTLTF